MTQPRELNGISDVLSREGMDWAERLTSGRMTRADVDTLQRWRRRSPDHARAFAEAVAMTRTILVAGRGLGAPKLDNVADVRARRSESIVFSRRALMSGVIAASSAGVVWVAMRPPFGLWPSIGQITEDLSADYRTDIGEQRRIAIGSVLVDMNTQTSVAVRGLDATPGIELIRGEAAIDIRGSTFGISSGAGRVRAERAILNVRTENASVCVTCVSGAARVSHPKGQVDLPAKQKVTYTSRTLQGPSAADPVLAINWRRGILVFHDRPLGEVVAELNRYRKGRIVLLGSALPRRLVYASFHLDKIDTVVDQMQQLSGARVLRVGELVFLS